jgi:hypothetical protein
LTSSAQRFNYDYSDATWEDLAEPIAQVARNSFTTHVILNNNHEDQGRRNAARLRTTLQRESYRRTDRILALAWLGRPALPLGMRGLRDRAPAASRIYVGRFQSIVRAVEERCGGYEPHCGQAPQNRH